MSKDTEAKIKDKLDQLLEAGWTQQALADALDVHRVSIYEWRNGKHMPAHPGLVLAALDGLLKQKPPKKRRYPEGHYLQRKKEESGE
jgi:hypothetical protein